MKDNYITAVLEELEAGIDPDKVLAGLRKILASRGHSSLYGPVLRGVYRVLSAGSAITTMVTVTEQSAYEKQKTAISSALAKLGANGVPKINMDETIIGGFVAEANNKRLDKSYKSKLVSLYRNLTK